jgi:hypothetical protein
MSRAVMLRASVRVGALASVLMWVAAVPARASAQDARAPAEQRHAVGGELSYFGKDEARTSIDLMLFQLSGRYVLDERFSFTGAFGIATLVSTPEQGEGDVVWRPSNPELMAFYRVPVPPKLSMRISLGIGVAGPLATITRGPDARLHRAALSYAQAMDGLYRMWQWTPNRTTAITSASVELRTQPWFSFLLEAKPALLIPSREDFYTDRVDFIMPTAAGVATGTETARLGVRLRAVLMPTLDVDNAQLSAESFGTVHVDRWFGEVRYVHNLDEPLAGERGPRAWGLHLGAGGEL